MMQRLRNMKISRKLTAGFSLVSAIAVLLAVLGLVGMANAQTTEETMQGRMNSMPVTAKVMTNLSQMQSACSFAVLNSSDAQTFQQSSDTLNQYQKLYEENYAELLTLRTADKWKKEIETAQNSYKNDYLPNVEQAMQLAQSGKTADAAAALQSAQKTEEQMMKTYDGLMAYPDAGFSERLRLRTKLCGCFADAARHSVRRRNLYLRSGWFADFPFHQPPDRGTGTVCCAVLQGQAECERRLPV